MGLELRRWICGRCWGRALAPPSSAEGERCGCLGSSEVVPGTGTVVRSSWRKGTRAGETEQLWRTETEPKRGAGKGRLGCGERTLWRGPCGTPVYGDGETPLEG